MVQVSGIQRHIQGGNSGTLWWSQMPFVPYLGADLCLTVNVLRGSCPSTHFGHNWGFFVWIHYPGCASQTSPGLELKPFCVYVRANTCCGFNSVWDRQLSSPYRGTEVQKFLGIICPSSAFVSRDNNSFACSVRGKGHREAPPKEQFWNRNRNVSSFHKEILSDRWSNCRCEAYLKFAFIYLFIFLYCNFVASK